MSEETKPAIGSLEQALSLEPLRSPTLEITVSGQDIKVQFREISQTKIDRLRMSAIQWIEDERRRREASDKDEDREWRDAQLDLDQLRANRLDLLMLQASMVDPATGGPACTLVTLENELSPEQQEFLAQKCQEWKVGIDPDYMSPETVDATIEYLKNALTEGADPATLSVFCWTQFGYKTLAGLVLTLVSQVETSQTEPSTGG